MKQTLSMIAMGIIGSRFPIILVKNILTSKSYNTGFAYYQ